MPTHQSEVEPIYTAADVAARLGVNVRTVRRWMREGAISHFRYSRAMSRITETQLQAFLTDYQVLPPRHKRRRGGTS
jgi:excisionase family DNA binding protein